MQKLKLLLIFFVTGSILYAQNTHSISGSVTDSKNHLVSIGDVLLFSQKDSTLVKYTTLVEGRFSIEDIPSGSYRLQISSIGFKKEEQLLQLDESVSLKVKLEVGATHLDEVEVVAAKPIFMNKNGNLKIDVKNPVFASIPDPMELLAKLPGIQISADRQSITFIGKSTPLIYVGNQRISIEEFNTLPVGDITSVEIIKNPSSKYEAEGRAVLLITRKISDTEGAQINLNETASIRQNFNNYLSLNGNLRKEKISLKGNFAYNDLQTWESNSFEFEIPEQNIFSDYSVLIDKNNRKQINTGGGFFYQINNTDYFSCSTNIRLQTDAFSINTDTFLRQGQEEHSIITETLNDNSKDFISANFNYNKRIDPDLELFTGLQYSSYVQKLNTNIFNDYDATGFSRSQDRQQKYRIAILAYRLDLEKTFTNEWKWEIGANFSEAKASALTKIRFFEQNSTTDINFDYTEKTYASYSQLSGKLRKKIQFNAGFRIENNQVKSELQTEDNPLVTRENTNFFPRAMMNVEIDSTKNLTCNYGKTIDRPNYANASSITVFINPFLEGAGNINLLPTITEEVSANFQFKNSSFSINYLKRKNPMYYTIGYDENVESAIFSLKNLDQESGLDISLTLPVTKGIWTGTNVIALNSRRIKDATARINRSKPYLYVYADHQFKIARDTTISFGGWGYTKRSEGIFTRNGLVSFNTAITKTFFDRLQCTFRWNDITRAMNFEERYSIDGVNANGVYFTDASEIAFTMEYSFGKSKEAEYKNKDIDENLDRIN